MPKRVTPEERKIILSMLAQGHDRDTIAAAVGVTPGQVSAIPAHVSMGTYALPDPVEQPEIPAAAKPERTSNLLRMFQNLDVSSSPETRFAPILLGTDAETGEEVFWNPDPSSGSANPHVLILGESGFGKTYTIASLAAELAEENVHSIVFDHGQGFSLETLLPEFIKAASPLELFAARDEEGHQPVPDPPLRPTPPSEYGAAGGRHWVDSRGLPGRFAGEVKAATQLHKRNRGAR